MVDGAEALCAVASLVRRIGDGNLSSVNGAELFFARVGDGDVSTEDGAE